MLEPSGKKQTLALGMRIGILFLAAFSILIFVAYSVLSKNFQAQFADYTIRLVQAMVGQGVTTVEYELRASREEAAALARSLTLPDEGGAPAALPAGFSSDDAVRIVYVSESGTVASDGRRRDVRDRPDIVGAFRGETTVYGPYFNEENEFLICYAAPVYRDGAVAGVLSVEKDGYLFCELIKSIQFMDSGESYIIDAQGTDIAVSDPNHIDWVREAYNARDLLEEKEDWVTRSIFELEQKGLNGESGVGTYHWEGSLCHLVYAPIPSTGWVLLAGVREAELAALTRSTLYASVSEGSALGVCIFIFLALLFLIFFWIIVSMRKSEEINHRLEMLANYDALTGLRNRNGYHNALDTLPKETLGSLACLYIDVNGLHEMNNRMGHGAGDDMLKAVAEELRDRFAQDGVYRIGGDEFVVFCRNAARAAVDQKAAQIRAALHEKHYDISVGIAWREQDNDVKAMVNAAEAAMQQDKRQFYQSKEGDRRMRVLNQHLERLLLEKEDAEAFLDILAPEFKGVYFINLESDTVRHLFIPSYFEEMLKETGGKVSRAFSLYAERFVSPADRQAFAAFCAFQNIEKQLCGCVTPELIYTKMDGARMKLRVMLCKAGAEQDRETMWIFSHLEKSE